MQADRPARLIDPVCRMIKAQLDAERAAQARPPAEAGICEAAEAGVEA